MSGHAFLYVPKSIVHRWITVLITCVLIGGAALPVIWLLVEPYCVVNGAIHVASCIPNILTGEPDGRISDYDQYMNTQALKMTSGRILQDVADDVAPRGLAFFARERPVGMITRLKRKLGIEQIFEEPSDTLKAAITAGTISAEAIPRTELIGVTMKYPDEREAGAIVDSFLRQFDASWGRRAQTDLNQTLARLVDQQRELAATIERRQNEMQVIERAHGTTAFDSRREMAMQRQKTLAAELTGLETQRLRLEARVAVLAQGGDSNVPADVLATARKQYVSSDCMVEELVKNIVEMKVNLIVAEQNLTPGAPEVPRRKQLLAILEAALEQKERDLQAEFDEQMRSHARERNKQRLASAKAELAQIQANEDRLREVLNEQESATRRGGLASADFHRLRFDSDMDRQLYEQVTRRKREIEMRVDGPSRVTIAYPAELASMVDSRWKLTGTVWIAGLLVGMVLAVARGPRKASR
ncbi:MAG: hypothetical protein JW741_07050 [Sedimentisphaerales bacterium]|nr:hypothetical protein [Sedimentisphaerales bacterium]